jgi:hypothetical protein
MLRKFQGFSELESEVPALVRVASLYHVSNQEKRNSAMQKSKIARITGKSAMWKWKMIRKSASFVSGGKVTWNPHSRISNCIRAHIDMHTVEFSDD